MAYGIQSWGLSAWGGSDFIITNHIPSDNATGVNRKPLIGFTLLSSSGDVTLASINLSANGIQLITSGAFTGNATGTIDSTNPAAVTVSAQVRHEFSPFALVTVVVSALNTSNQSATIGNTWQFNVDSTIHTFETYIVRRFERVLNATTTGLEAPQNPHAEVELDPPPNLSGELV